MKRRRNHHSSTTNNYNYTNIDSLSIDDTSSSVPGVNLISFLRGLNGLYNDFTFYIGLAVNFVYSILVQAGYDMALGIAKLWRAPSALAGKIGRGIDGEGDNEDEGIDMGSLDSHKAEEVQGRSEMKRRRADGKQAIRGGYYPGMVNLSGTLCYMNSVLQAFASIPSLINHLEKIINLAEEFDVPTPVTDTLQEVLQDLNTPHARPPAALRPTALITALLTLPAIQRLLSTREQQDAHELFLILAEAISNESMKVVCEIAKLRGLGEILTLQAYASDKSSLNTEASREEQKERQKKKRGLAQPWEGLMARLRTCRVCGWCEAIRMDTLGGIELSIPQNGDVPLEACIAQYLSSEHLSDVTCEMCSLKRTATYYDAEIQRLSDPSSSTSSSAKISQRKSPSPPKSSSSSFGTLEDISNEVLNGGASSSSSQTMTQARKKRLKEAKKVYNRLITMLESQTILAFGENTIPPIIQSKELEGGVSGGNGQGTASLPIKWQLAKTDSIRETSITRPPKTLRLHLIRSEYTPYGHLLKKSARIAYPVILDLTRFVSRGIWEENDRSGVLSALASSTFHSHSSNGTSKELDLKKRVLYRLESVILHYGYTHSSGHYVCIRRKPTRNEGEKWDKPRNVAKTCQDGCTCEECLYFGQVRDREGYDNTPGKGWLRISDDEVDECGVEALVETRGQVVMLFYERVLEAS